MQLNPLFIFRVQIKKLRAGRVHRHAAGIFKDDVGNEADTFLNSWIHHVALDSFFSTCLQK
jgi:hypothetical protein